MKFQIVTSTLIGLSLVGYSQEEPAGKSRIQLTSITLGTGLFTNSIETTKSVADFQKLAPNSDLLTSNLMDFENSSASLFSGESAFNANLIFKVNSKDNSNRLNSEFNLGFSFNSVNLSSFNLYGQESFRVDTLISNQNGNQFFVDSIKSRNYGGEYIQKQLFINASYTISSNPSNRLKFYTGIGLGLGYSLDATTTIYYNESSGYESDANASFTNYDTDFQFESESFKNKNGFLSRLFIPIGIDFRLSKKNLNWSKCHLLLETQPNLTYVSVPELGSSVETGNFSSLGFRYDF